MFRIMSEKEFQKALKKSRNEGYDEGYEDGKSYVEKAYGFINDCMQVLYKKEQHIENITKDRIVEVIKDVVIDSLNVSISEAADILTEEADQKAVKEFENEKREVPSAKS